MTAYPHLFSPLSIRGIALGNRIVFPPMNTGYPTFQGIITERLHEYLLARARGGAGLIIFEATYVDPGGRNSPVEVGLHDDRALEGFSRLAEAVHEAGSRLLVQLTHHGRMAPRMFSGRKPVGPSAEPASWRASKPCGLDFHPHNPARALSRGEITAIVDRFGEAARRACRAGLDGVEIHGAHGYLLSSFLSPLTNRRTDEYGGSIENRARFPVEVVRRVRAEVGNGMIIGFRINGEDNVEGGQTIVDTAACARLLESAGADLLHVSAGFYGGHPPLVPPMQEPHARFVPFADAVKKEVTVPVIGGGRIVTPEDGEGVLSRGEADLIFMGRALLADPDLPRKAHEGRGNEINICNGCCQCIEFGEEQGLEVGIHCLVNPLLGREGKVKITPGARRRVAIVGGGPAGLVAAKIAAARGHDVTLFEAEKEVGGRLLREACIPGKEDARLPALRLAEDLERAGVRLETGRAVSPEEIAGRFDAAVVAVGSEAFIPEHLAGSGLPCVTADEIFTGSRELRGRVVVLGEGTEAIDAGIFLAEGRTSVSILESPVFKPPRLRALGRLLSETAGPALTRLGEDAVRLAMRTRVFQRLADSEVGRQAAASQAAELSERIGIPITRPYAFMALRDRACATWRRPYVLAIGARGITIEDREGEVCEIYAPLTLVSSYRRPRPFDIDALRPCEAMLVGDAVHPGRALMATRQGFDAALEL